MTNSETEILDPEVETVALADGLVVGVNRLKTRETLKLLKILTRGAGYAISTIDINSDEQSFAESMLMAAVFAIPEAEEETIDFLKTMTYPAGLVLSPKNKTDKENNAHLLEKFENSLDNPDLDDLVSIFEIIVKNESPHIKELGKKLALLMKSRLPEKN